jgi:outer membrane protein TolC
MRVSPVGPAALALAAALAAPAPAARAAGAPASPNQAAAATPPAAAAAAAPPGGDAVGPVATAVKLTLADALQRALAANPTVAVAVAEIDRADALIKQARAGYWPTLNANGAYTRLDSDRLSGPQGGPFVKVAPIGQWTATLQLTVPLIAAPGWANTRHAESNRRIADASAADVRRLVAQAAARAYLTVVAEHRFVAAVETARGNAKEHFDYAHTRFAGGIGRAIDEVRAAQDLASVERQVQSTYVAVAQAREALGILVAATGPVDTVDEVDLGAVPTLAQALDEARDRRTDVKLLEQRLHGAKQAKGDIWAYYAPYLVATVVPEAADPPTALLPKFGWNAQLLLTLPLYDAGLRTGVSRERSALVAEAEVNLAAELRQAASDVRLSFESMLRADQALGSAREAARLAHKAYDLATLAYRAGASTNIEVLDAARQARDADTAVAQAEDLSRQARLDLLVASGRFP